MEASSRPGGRLKTDIENGFRFDHGFQVVFTAYPAFQQLLDLDALKLCRFEPGARIKLKGKSYLIHDDRVMETLLSPIFGLSDKLRVATWTEEVNRMTIDEIWNLPNKSVLDFFNERGFSQAFINNFAKPFLGGIFLDRSLSTSLRMFGFVWKMLSDGHTAVPALGMEEIPKQMIKKLIGGSIKVNTKVEEITRKDGTLQVKLSDGSTMSADRIVLATDAMSANNLAGTNEPSEFRSAACHYFETASLIEPEPILVLNANPDGIAHEIIPMSTVAPQYAPPGRHLVTVTTDGAKEGSEFELSALIKELSEIFPTCKAKDWRHLKSYHIPMAQMKQTPEVFGQFPYPLKTSIEGVILATEPQVHSGIHGALRSGQLAANSILKEMGSL